MGIGAARKLGLDEPRPRPEPLDQPGAHGDELAGEVAREVHEVAAVRHQEVSPPVRLRVAG